MMSKQICNCQTKLLLSINIKFSYEANTNNYFLNLLNSFMNWSIKALRYIVLYLYTVLGRLHPLNVHIVQAVTELRPNQFYHCSLYFLAIPINTVGAIASHV